VAGSLVGSVLVELHLEVVPRFQLQVPVAGSGCRFLLGSAGKR
jgi:hypothetical protein